MKTKRHVLFIIALLCSAITSATSQKCGEVNVKINESKTISLGSGYSTVLQYSATSLSYRWYSSSTSVATVSYIGFNSCSVTGKAEGTCKVYFTASFFIDGYYRTYDFYWDVTVSGYTGGGGGGSGTTYVNPTGVTMYYTEFTLEVGQTIDISSSYQVNPENADYLYVWTDHNKQIVSVDRNYVTALAPGETKISLYVYRKPSREWADFKEDCYITVTRPKCLLQEDALEAPQTISGVNATVSRTLIADEWNTICLPFAMTASQLTDAFGEDVQLGEFDGCEIEEDLDAGVKTIKVGFSEATALEANHPYIIKVSEDLTSFTVNNVNVVPSDNPVLNRDELVVDEGDGTVTLYNQFVGTYVANTIVPVGAYFLSGNKFYQSKGKTPMGAFRGYFVFNNTTGSNSNNDAKFILKFTEDGTFSGIERLGSKVFTSVYTLDGRRVTPLNGNQSSKGIYIINGKKTIVK